jgi:hypothetical protein
MTVNAQWPKFNEKRMNKNEVYAAIAMALHEHFGNNVHDIEPGIITIAEHQTQWNGYAQTMTAHP